MVNKTTALKTLLLNKKPWLALAGTGRIQNNHGVGNHAAIHLIVKMLSYGSPTLQQIWL